jgi:hypothetical protein
MTNFKSFFSISLVIFTLFTIFNLVHAKEVTLKGNLFFDQKSRPQLYILTLDEKIYFKTKGFHDFLELKKLSKSNSIIEVKGDLQLNKGFKTIKIKEGFYTVLTDAESIELSKQISEKYAPKTNENNQSTPYTFQNEPDGFRDIKWGTNFKFFKDMIPNKYVDNTYERPKENMIIDGAKTTGIYYRFYEDQFFEVEAYLLDYENFKILKNAYFKKFGEPDRNVEPNHYELYKWGNREHGKTFIFLKYDSGESSLLLFNPKLGNEFEKKEEQIVLDKDFKAYLTKDLEKQLGSPMIECLNSKSNLIPKKVKEVALNYGLGNWDNFVKLVADDEIMGSFKEIVNSCIKEIEESETMQPNTSNCDSEPNFKNGEPTFNACNDETKENSIQAIVSSAVSQKFCQQFWQSDRENACCSQAAAAKGSL